jgi:hypothetical protein
MIFEIPTRNDQFDYLFQTEIDGTVYDLRISYNRRMDSWALDFTGIAEGIRLVGGIDLLEYHHHKPLPIGVLSIRDKESKNRDPSVLTLGDTLILIYEN